MKRGSFLFIKIIFNTTSLKQAHTMQTSHGALLIILIALAFPSQFHTLVTKGSSWPSSYDTTNAARKQLHKAFIRQCLNNFKDNNSVIQEIGAEFTGPLHFVQFWIDVINQWEKENKQKEWISLSVTKDVQDAILADNKRSA